MARPSAPTFVADPLAAALSRGERPPQFGIACNVNFPPPPAARAPYEGLVAECRRELAAAGVPADTLYWYPFEHLHVTVATFVAFTATMYEGGDARAAATAAWVDWARRRLPSVLCAFELTARRVVVSGAAVFLLYDESVEIAALRRLIEEARTDGALLAAGAFAGGFKIPGIIHTTIARPTVVPRDPDAVSAALAAGMAWKPLTMACDAVHVVLEERPYMHIERCERTELWSSHA